MDYVEQLREMLKSLLLQNTELRKKVRVLEEILRSYLPILKRKKDE
jgi:hypothetical protein